MNKTKIIVSIGPVNHNPTFTEKAILSGADVIRLNMTYASYDFCKQIIKEVDEVNKKLNTCTGIMFDLEGPCIRTGKFKNDLAVFQAGDRIRLYTEDTLGDEYSFSVNYKNIIKDVTMHSIIKLSDGKVILEVVEKALDYLVLEVIKGGDVTSNSKVYLPNITLNRKYLTRQDKEDIMFASKMGVQYLTLSHISSAEDILEINDLMIETKNDNMSIIAKVQNSIAVSNLNEIIEASDGVIISRKDLAVELPLEDIPNVRIKAIKKALEKDKLCIVSAELESFINTKFILSRSEVSDLSNIVSSGADAIMLAGETTIGAHPIEAIKQVERVIKASSNNINYQGIFDEALNKKKKTIASTISFSAVLAALELPANAIIVLTNTGYTAKKISNLRPPCPIIAVTPSIKVAYSLSLCFGVISIINTSNDFDKACAKGILAAQKKLDLKNNDTVIITGGYPFEEERHTNIMKIEKI